jgi:uncharacterized protein YjbI with pentapeptide repeats
MQYPDDVPQLSGAQLHGAELQDANLQSAKLDGANLSGAHLTGANLSAANLTKTDLSRAYLIAANLREATLVAATLIGTLLDTASLSNANLHMANLTDAELSCANLSTANLTGAQLVGARLRAAKLLHARLLDADLTNAILTSADLTGADLTRAKLRHTNLGACLVSANLQQADLSGARLEYAEMGSTMLGNIDLSDVTGLDRVWHRGPSTIGADTLIRSKGKIPHGFLRGAGLPDDFIHYACSPQPIEFNSCFISYSAKDDEFAWRLKIDLQAKGVRCWFAPHDIRGGRKIYDEIDLAIHLHERLLLILSQYSIDSNWVKTEILKARKRERAENKHMLFPIRVVSFEALQQWEWFHEGIDMAGEIREYFIPDFSHWSDRESYNKALDRLLKDLKGENANKPAS